MHLKEHFHFMFSLLESKYSGLLNCLLRTAKVKVIRVEMGKSTINLLFESANEYQMRAASGLWLQKLSHN